MAPADITVDLNIDTARSCASQHIGPWLIEGDWFRQAVNAVKAGTWQPRQEIKPENERVKDPNYISPGYRVQDGVAIIDIDGQMQKKRSSFGGTSTIETRIAIREAVKDEDVQAIALRITSPGGTVDGTADLGDEVARAAEQMPVEAYIADLGASAAYWIAAQADRITANRTARIGSIGTFAVVEDMSQMAENIGVTVHLISTGPYKGAGVPGTEIKDHHLDHVQEIINKTNEHFLQAVEGGRGMKRAQVEAVADGRTFIAADALDLGLIDEIGSFDEVFAALAASGASVGEDSFQMRGDVMSDEETTDQVEDEELEDEPTETPEEETPEQDVEESPEPEETESAEEADEPGARTLDDYMSKFGDAEGARMYRDGLTWVQALEKHAERMQSERDELRQRIDQAVLGEVEENAPSHSPAEGGSSERDEELKRSGVSDATAAFASTLVFADSQE